MDAKAYYKRGIAKLEKGDFEGAIADYTQAIELKPDDAKAYYNRGTAKAKQGDFEGAIADYTQAIRLNPDFAEAIHNRAYVLGQQQQADMKAQTSEQIDTARKEVAAEEINQLEKWAQAQTDRKNQEHKMLRYALWGLFSVLVACVSVFACLRSVESPITAGHLFAITFPFLALIAVISSPIVWFIRITYQDYLKAEMLEQEFYNRCFVQKSVPLFLLEEKNEDMRRELSKDYYKYLLENSTADKLLRWSSKGETPSMHPIQVMLDKIKGSSDSSSS